MASAAMDVDLGETYGTAEAMEASMGKDAQAAELYLSIINTPRESDEVARLKELSIYKLGALYARAREPEKLRALLQSIRPFFATVPKAKTAKIVRSLIDLVAEIPDTLPFQIELCRDSIEWCRAEKRSFLRQRIEARLAALLLDAVEYNKSLDLLADLLREVKRLDDKPLLVEIQLVEARVHHALRNLPKAKASLTSARTAANSIYCPPALQAHIDMMAGTLHAEEKDYKTAFSYYYEAFENSEASANPEQAVLCLKYMLLTKVRSAQPRSSSPTRAVRRRDALPSHSPPPRARATAGSRPECAPALAGSCAGSGHPLPAAPPRSTLALLPPPLHTLAGTHPARLRRPPPRPRRRTLPTPSPARNQPTNRMQSAHSQIMTDSSDEVNAIINGKAGLRHAGVAMDAMRAVAAAHKKRSLADFEVATAAYATHLKEDPLVAHHLDTLYDILLQSNICRIIEPFSRCERARWPALPSARLCSPPARG
jgi:tetratricopeptide (TPR) repeat protein